MSAYICRACGAPLELNAGDRICKCLSCGAVQSVPLIDSEEKAEMCASAERCRREYRYDKAIELYEELIRAYPTDADLYWSMLLCRYGVEYITDGGESRISLNRTSARSLLADEDYRTALRYADSRQRALMTSGAAEIDRIRRNIVELSRQGAKYDIYLCCRENNERGMRTPEYTAAKDIYTRLTAAGYSVFFSAVSLEDVLASEYEPRIYAALSSARIMIVLGMSAESFSDVWVSNAYSRFARIAAEDSRRVIIPMFRGMDAGALPDQLLPYQAVDMSRLGYANDLVNSVGNILGKRGAVVTEPAAVQEDDPLVRRAYLHLEDGEFNAAADIAKKLLETDEQSAEAYLLLLMAEYHTADLEAVGADFSMSENYRSIMKYGSEGQRYQLRAYLNGSLYNRYKAAVDKAWSDLAVQEAAEGFRMLGDYKDSAELAVKAEELMHRLRSDKAQRHAENTYNSSVNVLNVSENISELTAARQALLSLGDYRDSAAQAEACQRRINSLKSRTAALNAGYFEHTAETKKRAVIAAALFAVVVMSVLLVIISVNMSESIREPAASVPTAPAQTVSTWYTQQTAPSIEDIVVSYDHDSALKEAEVLIEAGDYGLALDVLVQFPEYGSTRAQRMSAAKLTATAYMELGEYDTAREYFARLDSTEGRQGMNECSYREALELMQEGKDIEAEALLAELGDYNDSKDLLNDLRYDLAFEALEAGRTDTAIERFRQLGNFSNAPEWLGSLCCDKAEALFEQGQHDEALAVLSEVLTFSRAEELYAEYNLAIAQEYISEGNGRAALDYLKNSMKHDETGAASRKYIELMRSYYHDDNADYLMLRLMLEWAASYGYAYGIDEDIVIEGYMTLAQNYIDDGEYDKAIHYLDLYVLNGEGDALKQQAQALMDKEKQEHVDSAAADPSALSATELMVAQFDVGKIFTFGHYEQDNDLGNGSEPIRWVVFSNDGKKLSAISLDVLFSTYFGASEQWEYSFLREMLNRDFLEEAFTAEELGYLYCDEASDTAAPTADTVRIIDIKGLFVLPGEYFTASPTKWAQEVCFMEDEPQAYWCIGNEFPYDALVASPTGVVTNALDGEDSYGVRPVITIAAIPD